MLALGTTAKIAAAAIALQVATLSGWAWHASSLRGERDAANQERGAAVAGRDTCIAAGEVTQNTLAKVRKEHSICVAEFARATTDIAAANARAEEGRRQAQNALNVWRTRYDARGETCAAAQAALDTACAGLEGY